MVAQLGAPETLLDGIPGAGIHNGSRIVVGPDRLLYVTTGDAGSGGVAQDRESLGGKILRLTLDGRPAPGNPFGNAAWSIGHRNPQGLVFHPTTGVLYETEHGPSDNDEVNIIRRGGNYGWPDVHGMCDDDSGPERDFCRRNSVIEPLAAWTPTIAITGADFYLSDRIPGWRGSLARDVAEGREPVSLHAVARRIADHAARSAAERALRTTARRARRAERRRLHRDEQSRRTRFAGARRRQDHTTFAALNTSPSARSVARARKPVTFATANETPDRFRSRGTFGIGRG